jgi:hypothetical protein
VTAIIITKSRVTDRLRRANDTFFIFLLLKCV